MERHGRAMGSASLTAPCSESLIQTPDLPRLAVLSDPCPERRVRPSGTWLSAPGERPICCRNPGVQAHLCESLTSSSGCPAPGGCSGPGRDTAGTCLANPVQMISSLLGEAAHVQSQGVPRRPVSSTGPGVTESPPIPPLPRDPGHSPAPH